LETWELIRKAGNRRVALASSARSLVPLTTRSSFSGPGEKAEQERGAEPCKITEFELLFLQYWSMCQFFVFFLFSCFLVFFHVFMFMVFLCGFLNDLGWEWICPRRLIFQIFIYFLGETVWQLRS